MQSIDYSAGKGEFIRVEESMVFARFVPRKIYDITNALKKMSDKEQIKLMQYITHLTKQRITFEILSENHNSPANEI
ncbi:MAG: hypothetical protein IJ770_00215 [Alphaproteobacteria bacterium]|nr:hypothetical protein [Alphaproteobacteria bacterium]